MLGLIIVVFVLGYIAIALEHRLHLNKAASALVIGVICWTIYILNVDSLLSGDVIPAWFTNEAIAEKIENVKLHFAVEHQLLTQVGEIAGILFFLVGAMTIVELVDSHEGFAIVTNRIRATNKTKLLWIVAWLAFFMSSVLDNLTTTIVIVSLLRKLVHHREDRLLYVGITVIAANAGGAWTVIGDVTTTMLWIKHKIGTTEVMQQLFLGSAVCLMVPLIGFSRLMRGELTRQETDVLRVDRQIQPWHQWLFLVLGTVALLSVPIFKSITHLPPFMGMMLALGILWVVSEMVNRTMDEQTRSSTGVLVALKKVDMASVLFFLGILLAVGVLGATGFLQSMAQSLDRLVGNNDVVAFVIGLVSAVVDNVPMVAAGIEMYTLPLNDPFWMLLAYCAGTGGSCLIIGSAAGVAAMGLEHIDFLWYLKRITPWAFLGYVSGAAVILLQRTLF
jgi:Na+/H+ antiporter NhaD/arsenite permease-like protein